MNVVTSAQFKAAPHAYELSEAERNLRIHVAAAFRVAHHFGWNHGINNHITARLTDHADRFLMNPFGLGWDEITASNLVTIDFSGKVLSHDGIKIAPAGYNFHSGILKARPDLGSVCHVHATAGVVISATKDGLKIVDQSGCHLHGEVGTHDFEGFAQEHDEVPRILRDLGDKHCLMMWNHGLLTVGRTIGETFQYMRRLVEACALYERLLATGQPVREIPREVLDFTRSQIGDKQKSPTYSDTEWRYYVRLAERLDPSFSA